jgi:aldehyde dehydrogenase (NAD(P)+)
VQAASAEVVDKAVNAAHAALRTGPWKLLPKTKSGILINHLANLMEREKELLATIDTWDNGGCT